MDDEKIVVSYDVLESMEFKLKKHCKTCSLYVTQPEEHCAGCRLLDVLETLSVMICGDVNEWN